MVEEIEMDVDEQLFVLIMKKKFDILGWQETHFAFFR